MMRAKQTSFLPGLSLGDKAIIAGRMHTIRRVFYADPCATSTPEKYCECVCEQWGGVYTLSEKRLLEVGGKHTGWK